MAESPVTITVDLPADAARESADSLATRLRLLWVLDEVRQGRVTRARGAQLIGVGLDAFLREAAAHGVDAIDLDLEDFQQEMALPS